jgi:gas vesicle structural protein
VGVCNILLIDASSGGRNLVDVLDRVLDKGIVVDAWVRVALMGVDFMTMEAHVIVASIETYLRHADVLAFTLPAVPSTGRAVASREIGSFKVRRSSRRTH